MPGSYIDVPVMPTEAFGRKPLVFDPLGNGNLALRINNQKVSRLKECQEVASKWGLGRSVQSYTSM